MITVTLKGKPQSTNHAYKSHCRFGHPVVYMTAEGKALKEDYGWQAKSQYKEKPLDYPLFVFINLYFDSKRKHDIDNYNKLILDSLTGIVWLDDGQIESACITKYYDKKNPRVEIKVQKLLDQRGL